MPRSVSTRLDTGIEIHHHEAGEGDPVIFIHGAGPGASGLSNYQNNYSYFAERGFRVLMPDLVGWGQSSKPSGVTYNYELLGGSLRSWLRSLGIDRCSIAGNALGGGVGISLALGHPELVEHLVLLAPVGLAEPESYAPTPGMATLLEVVAGGRPISVEAMRKLFGRIFHDPAGIDDRVIAERTAMANSQPEDLFRSLDLPPHRDRLGELACPILMFWGESDAFCPVQTSYNLLRACPNSRLVVFAACGHWVQVERTDLFNRLTVDFLRCE